MSKINVNLVQANQSLSRHKFGNGVHIDRVIGDIDHVFQEQEIASLYQSKCDDLKIKMYPV